MTSRQVSPAPYLMTIALVGATLCVPGAVLAIQPGECRDPKTYAPRPFSPIPGHICAQGMNGCPAPYASCVLIGPSTGCPGQCQYRKTIASDQGSYCQHTGHAEDQCNQCQGTFVCDKYRIYTDATCSTQCPVGGQCQLWYRFGGPLCK